MSASGSAERVTHALLVLVAWLTISLCSVEARAERRIALWVEGRTKKLAADEIAREIRMLLPKDATVIDGKPLRVQLGRAGMRYELGHVITRPQMRNMTLGVVRRTLDAIEADVAVLGRLQLDAMGKSQMYLIVYDGNRGNAVRGDVVVPLDDGSPAARLASLAPPLYAALELHDGAGLTAAQEPEREPEPVQSAVGRGPAEPNPEPNPNGTVEPNMSAVALRVGYAVAGRRFRYSAPRTFNLRRYNIFGAHMVWADVEAYPFAQVPVAEYFGVFGGYGVSPSLKSEMPDGSEVSNTFDRLRTGLKLRIRTGAPPAPVLAARGTFGWLRYRFSSDDNLFFSQLPDVWYVFGGGGLEMRVPFWRFTIGAGADYLAPLSGGVAAARFRDATLHGLHATAELSFSIIEELSLALSADYTSVFYLLESQPTDEYVADSARDEVLAAQAALVYHYH